MDEIGYFGLAKRDLDRGGDETVYIVSEQPVARSRIDALAYEHDRLEREGDPASPYRWFVVRLDDAEIARLKAKSDD